MSHHSEIAEWITAMLNDPEKWEIARLLDVSANTLGSAKNGKSVRLDTAEKIIEGLGYKIIITKDKDEP